MIIGDIVQKIPTWPVIQELAFLKQQTGQDEATLFGSALLLGINWLYRQTVEQAFIEGVMPREEALKILGRHGAVFRMVRGTHPTLTGLEASAGPAGLEAQPGNLGRRLAKAVSPARLKPLVQPGPAKKT